MKRLLIVGGLLSVTLGCSSSPVTLSQDYGTSLSLVKQNQILHPEASSNVAAVVGLDGQASVTAYKQYIASFEKKSEVRETGTLISSMLTR